jgi:hypothetical protein
MMIIEAKPTNGSSNTVASGTVPMNTSAMPHSVPSMPARGVTRFRNGPMIAPSPATMPPMKPAPMPTCQASTASCVDQ